MQPIFKTEMLIYQSKAGLDVKILFGRSTHLSDIEIQKYVGLYENEDSICDVIFHLLGNEI